MLPELEKGSQKFILSRDPIRSFICSRDSLHLFYQEIIFIHFLKNSMNYLKRYPFTHFLRSHSLILSGDPIHSHKRSHAFIHLRDPIQISFQNVLISHSLLLSRDPIIHSLKRSFAVCIRSLKKCYSLVFSRDLIHSFS